MATPRSFSRTALLLAATLVVMVIPFLTLERQILAAWDAWRQQPHSSVTWGGAIVASLAADMLLPIPSSVIGTYAGAQFGAMWGSLLVWLGLSCGAISGYLLGYWGSPWLQRRLADPQELATLESWHADWASFLLVATRGLPLLAEASVFLAGLHRLPIQRFLPAVLGSNAGLALAYAMFGHWAAQHAWLPHALAVSAALPLVLATTVRWSLLRPETSTAQAQGVAVPRETPIPTGSISSGTDSTKPSAARRDRSDPGQ